MQLFLGLTVDACQEILPLAWVKTALSPCKMCSESFTVFVSLLWTLSKSFRSFYILAPKTAPVVEVRPPQSGTIPPCLHYLRRHSLMKQRPGIGSN